MAVRAALPLSCPPRCARVLVCGGRDWTKTAWVYGALDHLDATYGPFEIVIEGDAPGIDRMAGYWARKHRLDNLKFPADWQTHGRKAGPIRNAKMLDEGKPELVVAFAGGRGTADMVARAENAGIPVVKVGW